MLCMVYFRCKTIKKMPQIAPQILRKAAAKISHFRLQKTDLKKDLFGPKKASGQDF